MSGQGGQGGQDGQRGSGGPADRFAGSATVATAHLSALSALSVLSALSALTLAACQDDAIRPPISAVAPDSADQVLEGMEHLITTDGVRRTRVIADTAFLYESTNLARLKVVKVTFYDANGNERSTVTSDSGLYHMRDGSMSAWGHVVAVTPDNRRLQSAELKYDSRSKQISSDKPFVYDRADQHLEGNGFTSDPDFRNVVTRQPRGGERRGGGAAGVLPGQ